MITSDFIMTNQKTKKIENEFLDVVLKPYKSDCKYLKEAYILDNGNENQKETGFLQGFGYFSIPESCYIESTGHFNSVEFNICYNQLAYVLYGLALKNRMLSSFFPNSLDKSKFNFDDFLIEQISSIYIAKLESKFLGSINPKNFWGKLTVTKIVFSQSTLFGYTNIEFSDDSKIKAKGCVLIAFQVG